MGVWIYFVLWNIFKYQMLPPCSRAGGPGDVIAETSARLGGGVSDAN
jgi:hypothetical protein